MSTSRRLCEALGLRSWVPLSLVIGTFAALAGCDDGATVRSPTVGGEDGAVSSVTSASDPATATTTQTETSESEPASTCVIDDQSRLVCDNAPDGDIHAQPDTVSEVVDVLRTTHSWFDCWTQGEPWGGAHTTWYHTTGDDNGNQGYMPGSILVAPSSFDPAAAGLVECGAVPTTGPEYASALLAMWGGRVTGNDVAEQDLIAAANDQTITNSDSCGNTIKIDPALLEALWQLTDKYDLIIWNIVTGHGCDQYFHPKGQASDLGGATDRATGVSTNFGPGTSGDDQDLDRAFVEYFASILPPNSGLGQSNCDGRTGATIPPDIHFFSDTCNHQHVQMDY